MKNTPNPVQPSPGELEILRVLWTHNPKTVREVWKELNERRAMGYTTVLKLMQIMTRKGLVQRDIKNRAHAYKPAISEPDTQRWLVTDLLSRAFVGNASQLVSRVLEARKASPEELREIRALLDEYERRRK